MLENTPRMVGLPVAGSMWTPSQVSQQSNWGLDFIAAVRRRLEAGANHFGNRFGSFSLRGPEGTI
jgi:hypothetical protein